MNKTRTYYWEHATDESKALRSPKAAEMVRVALAAGGEIGVILDDGGPLQIVAVEMRATIRETVAAMESA